jgi:hypothetical protein
VKTIIEPFEIKMAGPIALTTPQEREEILRRAYFNVFQIPAEQVITDLLTDSGTSAMSAERPPRSLACPDSIPRLRFGLVFSAGRIPACSARRVHHRVNARMFGPDG